MFEVLYNKEKHDNTKEVNIAWVCLVSLADIVTVLQKDPLSGASERLRVAAKDAVEHTVLTGCFSSHSEYS